MTRLLLIPALLFAGACTDASSPSAEPAPSTATKVEAKAKAPAPSNAAAEPKNYELSMSVAPEGMSASQDGELNITIAPKEGWVLKTTTPFKAKLSCDQPCALATDTLTATDMVDPESAEKTVRTKVSATTAGKHTVEADLAFFLCTDEICQRYTDKSKVEFEVAASR